MDLRTAARILGGTVSGRNRILCPGPGHSRHDRSLAITIDPAFPDGFAVHSFAGDDWQAAKDHVRSLLGLDLRQDYRQQRCKFAPFAHATDEADKVERTRRALSMWNEAGPFAGTPAEAYLARRGLSYEGEALRWHPACPFGKGTWHGCMVALVRNIRTNEPQAIHRTAIDPQGRKIDRKAYGPIGGGAIKLTDNAEVERVIAIGEGIESTLSIRQLPDLGGMPAWAALSAWGIETFPVLPGIETVWIIADNDISGSGQKAAQTAAKRLHEGGIETIIVSPSREGDDLNDLIRKGAQFAYRQP